jgi:hypothetical protein
LQEIGGINAFDLHDASVRQEDKPLVLYSHVTLDPLANSAGPEPRNVARQAILF